MHSIRIFQPDFSKTNPDVRVRYQIPRILSFMKSSHRLVSGWVGVQNQEIASLIQSRYQKCDPTLSSVASLKPSTLTVIQMSPNVLTLIYVYVYVYPSLLLSTLHLLISTQDILHLASCTLHLAHCILHTAPCALGVLGQPSTTDKNTHSPTHSHPNPPSPPSSPKTPHPTT